MANPFRKTHGIAICTRRALLFSRASLHTSLIVQEYIRWARENGIAVGPGRGSAAGAICTYAMGITDLDPLPNGLLFERFLSPERVEMPDIDAHFEDERRQEVIEHIKDFYGEDHVSGVITFGKLQAKNAIRDAARVLGQPYSVGDRLCKTVGDELGITIDKALDANPDFKKAYDEEPETKEVVDAARSIEGNVRGEGVHACATIICDGGRRCSHEARYQRWRHYYAI